MKGRLKRLLKSGSRISTQLHLAIWGVVALTAYASLVAWLSFNRVGDVQSRVNEGSIPDIAASFEVAQYSGLLVAATPRLTASTKWPSALMRHTALSRSSWPFWRRGT